MADSPVRVLVKIGDPTTPGDEAGVDASGNLQVISAANIGVNIGDVDFVAANVDADDDVVAFAQTTLRTINLMYASDGVQWERLTSDGSGVLDVGLSAVGGLDALDLIDDVVFVAGTDTYSETTSKGNLILAVRNDSLDALADTNNEFAPLQVDAAGSLYVTGGGGGQEYVEDIAAPTDPTGSVSLMKRDDIIASSPVDAEDDFVSMLCSAEGALWVQDFNSDAMAGDLNTLAGLDLMLGNDFSNVFGAATLITVTQADNLADTLDGLQTTTFNYVYDGANWDRMLGDQTDGTLVNLGVNNDVTAAEFVGATPIAVHATETDTAVDATFNVDEADTSGTLSYCTGFDASSSVPIKAELQSVDDGTGTPVVTLFAAAGEPIHWRAPHRDYFQNNVAGSAGFDGWRVVITNKDGSDAADVYGTIYTERA